MTTPTRPPGLPDLPDLTNLRDVGGLRTADGRRVRAGVLYRAATPAFLDAAQARVLVDDLGIRTRLDLRGEREIAEETSPALLAREHRALALTVHSGGLEWDWTPAGDRTERVAHHYLAYARSSPTSVVGVVRALLADDGVPALVHCSAGKDRTGTVVALVLGAVGVVDDDLVADYAASSAAMPALRAQLDRLPAYQDRLARLPDEAFDTTAEMMTAFLALVAAEHGGPRDYLLAHGVMQAELAALEALLIEPV